MNARRGGFLTVMSILLGLAAMVDLLKAFRSPPPPAHEFIGPKMPATGIVVLGMRHTGTGATILGPLLGAILIFYAVGIWRMKRYAMTVGWIYAAYVILNATLFTIRNPAPPTVGAMIFAIVYLAGAIVLTVGTAIALARRSADLS
jgi:hypothetical protein